MKLPANTASHSIASAERPVCSPSVHLPRADGTFDALLHGRKRLPASPQVKDAAVCGTAALDTAQKSADPRDVATCMSAPLPTLSVVVGRPETVACGAPVLPERIARPLLQALGTGLSQLELRLHPAELGGLTLHMTLQDNLVRLHMQTDTESASQRLQGSMQVLATTLSEHGLVLSEYTICVNPKNAPDCLGQLGKVEGVKQRSHKEPKP